MVFSFTDVYKKNFQLKRTVVLVKGIESVLIDDVVRKLVAHSLPNHVSTEQVETLEADVITPKELSNCLNTLSFFSEKRIVVLKKAGEVAFEAKKILVSYLNSPSPDILLILTFPEDAQSSRKDRKSSGKKQESVKELEKEIASSGDVIDCSFRHKSALPEWVASEAEKYGKKMSPATLLYFLECVGQSASRIPMELKKLSAFCAERNVITEDDIAVLVVPHFESTVFQLIDAVCAQKTKNALELLERLLDQKQDANILYMLSRQFKMLMQAKALHDKGVRSSALNQEETGEISPFLPEKDNLLRMSPFVQNKLFQMEKSITLREIEQALIQIHDTDLSLKGAGNPMQERIALELLVMRLSERKKNNGKKHAVNN